MTFFPDKVWLWESDPYRDWGDKPYDASLDAREYIRADLVEPNDVAKLLGLSSDEDGTKLELLPPHWAATLFCGSFRESLGPAPNYVEMTMTDPPTGDVFVVTIRRGDGKTPTDLKNEADAEVARWTARVKELEARAERAERALRGEK